MSAISAICLLNEFQSLGLCFCQPSLVHHSSRLFRRCKLEVKITQFGALFSIDASVSDKMTAPGDDHIAEIVAFIKQRVSALPEVAIVCGSGLSGLSKVIQDPVSVPYEDIPYFPRSTVAGHGTELVFGKLGGRNVVAQRGRFHFYEGWNMQQVGRSFIADAWCNSRCRL